MIIKMKKNINITSLTIRINESDCSRCCFDVLANGLQLTDGLTFGELVEYLVTVYRDKIFGFGYTEDYPFISINGIGLSKDSKNK